MTPAAHPLVFPAWISLSICKCACKSVSYNTEERSHSRTPCIWIIETFFLCYLLPVSISECTPKSIDQFEFHVLLWKNPKGFWFICFDLCSVRQSTSAEQILVQAPYPSVHTSLQSLENQTPSLFHEDDLIYRNSVIPPSCHLVSLL